MKKLLLLPLLALIVLAVLFVTGYFGGSALEKQVKGLDARQALALANRWHGEHQPVKSHVTSKEIVFEFEDGKIKRVRLPKDEMMVAVAPFVDQTHT